jgi:NAD(P)-dependent dehydrogenase (short-subunit alcohol dehydrogenase family)
VLTMMSLKRRTPNANSRRISNDHRSPASSSASAMEHRSVLITGSSKGIGRAMAIEFAARGHRVIATARDPRTPESIDVDQRLRLDVTDQQSVNEASAAAGEVDILVSNAGALFHAAVEATPPTELMRLFEQNTAGAIRVAQAVLPQMRERGSGRLMFVSSVVSGLVLPGSAAYAASKWALEALVEGLASSRFASRSGTPRNRSSPRGDPRRRTPPSRPRRSTGDEPRPADRRR